MKDTKQIAETVLKIRDAEQERIMIRNRRIRRAAAAASTALVFCGVLLATRQFNSSQVEIPTISDEQAVYTETTTTISETDNSTDESAATEHTTKAAFTEVTSAESPENSTILTEEVTLSPMENGNEETTKRGTTVVTTAYKAPSTEQVTINQIETQGTVTTVAMITSLNVDTQPTDTTTQTPTEDNDITTMSSLIIRLYNSAAASETQYTEIKKNEVVKIETDYNPIMSNRSGIGILLEFDSKGFPITLSTNNGHFTEWNIETGMGTIQNVGTTYDIGNKGYVFWTPDQLDFTEDFESVIFIIGNNSEKNIEMGKIVVSMSDYHTLYAVLKE